MRLIDQPNRLRDGVLLIFRALYSKNTTDLNATNRVLNWLRGVKSVYIMTFGVAKRYQKLGLGHTLMEVRCGTPVT